jgi:hypothetical protein
MTTERMTALIVVEKQTLAIIARSFPRLDEKDQLNH